MPRLAALILACVLVAGCSHGPAADQANPTAMPAGCTPVNSQATWQAETAPVIDKRQGQEALEKEEGENGEGQRPCP